MSREFLGFSILLATVAACYTGGSAESMAPGSGHAGNVGTAGFDITGLPCDVAAMLAASCSSCHGASPSGGAPNALTTYEQLMAPSMSDPSLTVAQVSVQRMKDTKSPMPPGGGSASDVAVLEGWLAAGAPAGTCTTSVGGGGSYGGPSVCTSGTYWTRGNHGSSSMHPGSACVSCHSQQGEEDGPQGIAGTVFPTAHEPDDCNGTPGTGVTVEITDATGTVTVLRVNGVGNFYSRGYIAFPYTAKVVSGTKTRAMKAAQTDGDCNSCHTEGGTNGAPGRIIAP